MWLLFAAASAFFAGITAILAKCGIRQTDSTVATALRTCVVLVMAWVMVPVSGQWAGMQAVTGKAMLFLVLSGLCTGASWLCYFRALQDGPASVVAPVDKLSILVTVAFSAVVFGERLSRKAAIGLALNVAGTLLMLL